MILTPGIHCVPMKASGHQLDVTCSVSIAELRDSLAKSQRPVHVGAMLPHPARPCSVLQCLRFPYLALDAAWFGKSNSQWPLLRSRSAHGEARTLRQILGQFIRLNALFSAIEG